MDNTHKEMLRRLNLRFIQTNGAYIVTDKNGTIVRLTRLTVEDIRYLRWYHQDDSIAHKVQVPELNKKPSANVETKKPVRKPANLTRDQKYNKPKYRLKEPIRVIGKYVVIFGMVVCIGVAAFNVFTPSQPE